ncbi:hypothetical protein VTL71DRAFT_7595 [Oculimacula yallundae]|uniref:Uncharacterized protein n=1 Tax=Oculimacula yallundae TaxID=86028 RepID=A0ABR4BVE0_9HELO
MASSTTTSRGTQTGSDSPESKLPNPPSAPPIPHHLNWVCCICKEWTNHPTGSCLRLLKGLKLINYNWVACRHEKCLGCVKVTEERWAERFLN